ncbi:MAG: hypothetical protein ACJ72F_05310 [Nitrososphaeraceae archaeon]
MKEKNDLFFQLNHNMKMMAPLFALVLVIIIAGTIVLPLQVSKAQNTTITMGNSTGAGNASSSTVNVTSTGDEVSNNVIANLAAPGYGNKYDVAVAGNTVPVNYNILQGSLVGILADPVRHSLDVAVNPGPQGGALEIQVPRYLVDSKTATNSDKPFVVLMDGQRISGEPTGICVSIGQSSCANLQNTFKQTQSSSTDRVLTILFGEDSRFIEIRGNTGTA